MDTEQIIVLVISLLVLIFGAWAVLAQAKGESSASTEDFSISTKDPAVRSEVAE